MSNVLNGTDPRRAKVSEALGRLLAERIGAPPTEISSGGTLLDFGVDSLLLLEVSEAIHYTLGVRVPFRLMLDELSSLEKLIDYVSRALPESSTDTSAAPIIDSGSRIETAQMPAAGEQPETSLAQEDRTGQREAMDATLLDGVIIQQLQIMAQQLELLRMKTERAPAARDPVAATRSSAVHPMAVNEPRAEGSGSPRSESDSGSESFAAYRPIQVEESRLRPAQQRMVDRLVEVLGTQTKRSKQLVQAHRQTHADSRASSSFRSAWKELCYPLMVARGAGSRIWDVDGNEYVDLAMGFGSMLFGHSPPFILEALREQMEHGIFLGPDTPLAGRAAELVCDLTRMERAAFCNSGTDAVRTALRVAKAVTGRTKVALFSRSYHGTLDGELEDITLFEDFAPKSLGLLEREAGTFAAVLVDPLHALRPETSAQYGLGQTQQSDEPPWYGPARTLVQDLRRITRDNGAALIFDEVLAGFRLHPGGSQSLFRVRADLATYGSAIAGGLPIGVIVGAARYMDAIDGGTWQFGDDTQPQAQTRVFAGTLFKDPLPMAAACAVLEHLKEQGPALQMALTTRTRQLADRLAHLFVRENVPIRMAALGSLFRFQFPEAGVWSELFHYLLLCEQVYVGEDRVCYLSTAHTDADTDRVFRAVERAVDQLKAAEFLSTSDEIGISAFRRTSHHDALRPFTLAGEHGTTAERGGANECGRTDESGLDRSADPSRLALTESQAELWFLAQLDEAASRAFNISNTLRFRDAFDIESFRRALQKVVERHEGLRVAIAPDGTHQLILPRLHIEVPLTDLSTSPPEQRERDVAAYLRTEASTPFDLSTGPLIRTRVLTLGDTDHILVVTVHHIIADATALALIESELVELYEAERHGRHSHLPEPIQLTEYVEREARLSEAGVTKSAEDYWIDKWRDAPDPLELPVDRSRQAIPTFSARRTTMAFDSTLSEDVKKVASRRGTTIFMIMLSLFEAWLQRLTGQPDIAVGIFAARRGFARADRLVADCVTLLPLRSRITGNPTFEEWMRVVRSDVLDAQEHEHASFGRIVKGLGVPRDPSRQPLVNVTFNMDPAPGRGAAAGLRVERVGNPTVSTVVDLSCNVSWGRSELLVRWDYNADILDEQTIERWQKQFQIFARALVADPQQRLLQAPLVSPEERRQLTETWNATAAPIPDVCIHRLVEVQAASSPDAVAAVCGEEHLTYEALNRQANQLAHDLWARGVGPEVCVGLCVERSLDLIRGVLAILKAGGAYVPLDPAYPSERLALMLADSRAAMLLTHASCGDASRWAPCPVVYLDRDHDEIGTAPASCPAEFGGPDTTAYVLYTSGSTGRPKGVSVQHRAFVNILEHIRRQVGVDASDVIAAVTAITFDIAGLELLLPLAAGARLVLIARDTVTDAQRLAADLTASHATIVQTTPATWRLLLAAGWSGSPRLRILCGGETLPFELVRELLGEANTLLNLYGPTETTIWSTSWVVRPGLDAVPIGRPIANTQVYIVDSAGQVVPVATVGELLIGGAGLARGYVNQPGLTAEKFVPDPFGGVRGGRLYRTGDRARWRTDGELEFVGRRDHQVKIHGFRVELGEIEAVLRAHPLVFDAVVVPRERTADNTRLFAYFVPAGQTPTIDTLRTFLKERLPDYMLPAQFVPVTALPLSTNGKVNRRALPQLDAEEPALRQTAVAPRTPTETTLAALWRQVLGVPQVGVTDNFFELGGDSILALQIVSRAQQAGFRLTPRQLFEHQTVADLALAVPMGTQAPVEQVTATRPVPSIEAEHHTPEEFGVDLSQSELDSLLRDTAGPGPVSP